MVDSIERKCKELHRAVQVEQIQDFVVKGLYESSFDDIARNYEIYRYKHALARKENTTDKSVLALLNFKNEEIKQENSNKNCKQAAVLRDYLSGEVSKDILKRYILPQDIVDAHENGILHYHDSDFVSMPLTNCCLIDLAEVFKFGTVINGTYIEEPKSFETACTIASQVCAAVSASQYGGMSVTCSHLAPYVDVSRQKHRKRIIAEFDEAGISYTDEQVNQIAEKRTLISIKDGIQTFNFQINSLMMGAGQSPFTTVALDINEVPEGQVRNDLALVIEEVLRQRIEGMKNEVGVPISVAFPKLIYFLDENNVEEGSEWFYLTELAAYCSSKRLTPDYISRKKMAELKDGDCYPVMGCRSALTVDRFTEAGVGNIAKTKGYIPGQRKYYGRFNQGRKLCPLSK